MISTTAKLRLTSFRRSPRFQDYDCVSGFAVFCLPSLVLLAFLFHLFCPNKGSPAYFWNQPKGNSAGSTQGETKDISVESEAEEKESGTMLKIASKKTMMGGLY